MVRKPKNKCKICWRNTRKLDLDSGSRCPSCHLTQFYRWQALRRNKTYQALYQKNNYYHDKPSKDDPQGENSRKGRIDSLLKNLQMNFGLNEFFDYKIVSLPKELHISGRDVSVRKGTIEKLKEHGHLKYDYFDGYEAGEQFHVSRKPRKKEKKAGICRVGQVERIPRYIQVVIDCDGNSTDILTAIEQMVSRIQSVRERKLMISRRTSDHSRRNELTIEYDRVFRIYDLHERGGGKLPTARVARREWSSADSRCKKRVLYELDRAKKYIEERGYVNIDICLPEK